MKAIKGMLAGAFLGLMVGAFITGNTGSNLGNTVGGSALAGAVLGFVFRNWLLSTPKGDANASSSSAGTSYNRGYMVGDTVVNNNFLRYWSGIIVAIDGPTHFIRIEYSNHGLGCRFEEGNTYPMVPGEFK